MYGQFVSISELPREAIQKVPKDNNCMDRCVFVAAAAPLGFTILGIAPAAIFQRDAHDLSAGPFGQSQPSWHSPSQKVPNSNSKRYLTHWAMWLKTEHAQKSLTSQPAYL